MKRFVENNKRYFLTRHTNLNINNTQYVEYKQEKAMNNIH